MGHVNEHDLLEFHRGPISSPDGDRTILCVQPNGARQNILREALQKYAVEFVTTAYDTLRQANARGFDAFVLEYWLPDWSGVSLCRDIRRLDPNAPVFFYTQAAGEEPRKRAMAAKASAYLCAPASVSAVRALVRTLVECADVKSASAKTHLLLAIQHELRRHPEVAANPGGRLPPRSMAMIERVAKIKAQNVFKENGGTLANFERWWPHCFLEVLGRAETLDHTDKTRADKIGSPSALWL